MLKRNLIGLLLILTFGISAAFAQDYSTLAENPNERAAILKAMSVPVSKELKQKITFADANFKVKGDWAFVMGTAKNEQGGEVNWKLTKYQKFIDNGDFEEGVNTLLKKTGGKWRVVKYMMNCHDVCYLGWDEKYKAPKAIFE